MLNDSSSSRKGRDETANANDTQAVRRCTRRAALVGASALLLRRTAAADVTVPIRLQAELLAKVASYDRNFAERTGDRVRTLLLVKPGDHESSRAAAEMKSALSSISTIGTLSHDEEIVPFSDVPALAEQCRARKIAITYFAPGFDDRQIEAIREALGSLSLLTVGSLAEYIPAGIVLGFDLVSGRPKLLVNLTQARRQHVEFRAEILKLTKVFE